METPHTHDTRHRLFVCIMPPKEVRDEARDIQRVLTKYNKLRFTNLEQIHLTIKFLGNKVTKTSAGMVIEELEKHSGNLPPAEITLDEVEFGFQAQNKPNVLYLSTQPSPTLDNIIEHVQKYVKQLNLPDVINRKDKDKFLSHITVGSVKKDISKSHIRKINEDISKFTLTPVSFTVNELTIVESVLTNKGPIYKPYALIPLKGKRHQQ